jgi:hypothetical protein
LTHNRNRVAARECKLNSNVPQTEEVFVSIDGF